MVGKTLSHYRILEELGRGGMGIVYEAEDVRLDRIVAIKVLPASALSSEDDRARFYREAKSAAQLHHPNIASVFEIDEASFEGEAANEPRPFIAMEFVDGESLQEMIRAGPLKIDEAVRIATQVAHALEAAHEKNIVHRDIKAANVMMTKKGDAKVLDFGLAKTTQATMLTKMGSTVGTAAYMSPEQTRGEGVDHRSDLWSVGVLLYELIAGKLPFTGDYEQAITYSILSEDPEPLTALRTGVPMGLEWIVSKLLAKKADDRYQSAKDLIVDLRMVDLKATGMSRVSTVSPETAQHVSPPRRPIPAVVWAVAGALAAALIMLIWPRSSDDGSMAITPKRIVQPVAIPNATNSVDISQQGDKVAFGGRNLQVLNLGTGELRAYDITGTVAHIDFSEDGEQILLTKEDGVERMRLSTGSIVHVVSTQEGGPRAEWRNDDFVVYEEAQSIFGISITTSEVRQIVERDSSNGEYDLDYPYVLPDGNTLVATAEFDGAPSRIGFWDIESGRNLGYLNYPGYRVQWLSTGYLVFSMGGNAMALPFDIDKLKQTGPIISIERLVDPQSLSISNDGTLVRTRAGITFSGPATAVVPVIYRKVGPSGDLTSGLDRFPPAFYANGVVGPDGKMAAVAIHEFDEASGARSSDIWILDFATGGRRALTRGGRSDYPAWSPAGDSIYFIYEGVNDEIRVIASSGRGDARTVRTTPLPMQADLTISPDGKWAVTAGGVNIDSQSRLFLWDLGSFDLFSRTALETPNGNPRQFDFSPNGKYLAFEDRGAIFVLPTDDLDSTPYLIWENSMTLPQWSADGSGLSAWQQRGGIQFVDVQSDPVFTALGAPRPLFDTPTGALVPNLFDVFPDDRYLTFLAAYPDPNRPFEAATDSVAQLVDVHFIINLPAILAR